jgi:hypothetical protein
MTVTAGELQWALAYRMLNDTDNALDYLDEEELAELRGENDYSSPPDWIWHEYHWGHSDEFVVPGIDGTVAVVESEGGGEGSGEHMHIVFRVSTTDGEEFYFKIDGYYASFDGASWDGSELYEVTPRQKTITVYE